MTSALVNLLFVSGFAGYHLIFFVFATKYPTCAGRYDYKYCNLSILNKLPVLLAIFSNTLWQLHNLNLSSDSQAFTKYLAEHKIKNHM